MERDAQLHGIADEVARLVDAREHTEPYFKWTSSRHKKLHKHVRRHGSLLDQLRAQLPPGGGTADDEGAIGSGADGRPPLAMDVLAVLLRIEAGSAHWASFRLRRDLRETVEENLRLLVGASTRLEDPELKDLATAIHGWYSSAATLTGWQSAPFTPRAACPLCARMGSLRINPDQKRALCVECGQTWEEADGSIGLLADEIRASAPAEMHTWVESCGHAWRLTTVGPDGVRGYCLACHSFDVRRSWPKGTPVWTELDEHMRGASA
jgi:hypothetical protein